jgi:hypothetical protein
MDRKADEFRHLKMGGMSVQEYANRYQELMRYVPDDTDTEKKKVYWFRKGLHKGMAHHLSTHDCPTLRSIINKALIVERSRLEYMEVRGSKSKCTNQAGAQVHPRGRGHVTLRATRHSRGTTPLSHSHRAEPTQEAVRTEQLRPRPPPQSADRAKVASTVVRLGTSRSSARSGCNQEVGTAAVSSRLQPSHQHQEDSHPVHSRGPHSRQLLEAA